MNPATRVARILPLIVLFLFGVITVPASSIQGFVFDQARNALSDVDIELLNENRQMRERDRTNSVGRYMFSNLPDGRYFIKVMPFRYNFEDETQEVNLVSFSVRGEGVGNTTEQVDFYLSPRKGGLGDTVTGVVYAQEVPKEAEDLYKASKKSFADGNKQEGINHLVAAVKAFPKYYYALYDLGIQLLANGRYLDSASMFVRAVEENPKSSKGFYWMGVAFSRIDKDYYKSALLAFSKAEELAPNAYQIPFEAGKLERELGNFVVAEQKLKRAKKVSDTKVPEISLHLAKLYSDDLKDYAKAADELESYLKESKTKDEALKAKIAEFRARAVDNRN